MAERRVSSEGATAARLRIVGVAADADDVELRVFRPRERVLQRSLTAPAT